MRRHTGAGRLFDPHKILLWKSLSPCVVVVQIVTLSSKPLIFFLSAFIRCHRKNTTTEQDWQELAGNSSSHLSWLITSGGRAWRPAIERFLVQIPVTESGHSCCFSITQVQFYSTGFQYQTTHVFFHYKSTPPRHRHCSVMKFRDLMCSMWHKQVNNGGDGEPAMRGEKQRATGGGKKLTFMLGVGCLSEH